MNQYIVSQIILVKQENLGNSTIRNIWECLLRKANAETEEEAIGKFVIATKDIEHVQKLNIECYLISNIKTI